MTDPIYARRLRQLLYLLVILLTFEGIARKAAPSQLRVPIFLLKDVFVLIMGTYVLRMPLPAMLQSLGKAYIFLMVLLVPPLLVTAVHDPLLAVFGAKQYLLYPIVGFATYLAFEDSKQEAILTFYRRISLLIIPTTLFAVVQSRLPSDHWINMSVSGESLRGFSAGGELRVSSTFSFVAQYCAFLNAQSFIILLGLHGWSKQTLLWKIVGLTLLPALILGCFITGSRGAVAGNISIILVGAILVAMKFRIRNLVQIFLTMVMLYAGVLAINYFFPHATAAYSAREDGRLIGFSAEIRGRVFDSFFNLSTDKSLHTFWGNGLGVMSNGADTFSSYAAAWRVRTWTETDFATTLFEGGLYTVLVWYGFRAFVILKTVGHFLSDASPELSVPLAFCQAFVIILGVLAGLALQPPIAIWWWFGVGTALVFYWKCIEPPETVQKRDEVPPPPPVKKLRGRSLYADVIHPDK
jgi:hypothetical protein